MIKYKKNNFKQKLILGLALAAVNNPILFAVPQVVTVATNINASGTTEGVEFVFDGPLNVPDGNNIGITGPADTGISVNMFAGVVNTTGIINFEGSSTVPGTITPFGTEPVLKQINIQGDQKTVTLQGGSNSVGLAGVNLETKVGSIDFQADATLVLDDPLDNGIALIAPIDSSIGKAGTIKTIGATTIGISFVAGDPNPNVGKIGETTALKNLVITGAGKTVEVYNEVNIENVQFQADGVLNFNGGTIAGKSIGNVTTNVTNTGIIEFNENTDVGPIGSDILKLKAVSTQAVGGKVINFNGNINANNMFVFSNTANIANNAIVNSPLSAGAGAGVINYLGNSTSKFDIGTAPLSFNQVNFKAGTFNLGHDVYSNTTNIDVGAKLNITSNANFSKALVNNGTININDKTVNIDGFTNNAGAIFEVNVKAGETPTAGILIDNQNANVNANSVVKVTVTDGFIPDKSKIQILQSAAGVNVNLPQVTGGNFLNTFNIVTDNGALPGKDLFLINDRRTFPEVVADKPYLLGIAGALEVAAANPEQNSPQINDLINTLNAIPNQIFLEEALASLVPIVNGSILQSSFIGAQKGLSATTTRLEFERERLHQLNPNHAIGYNSGDLIVDQNTWIQPYLTDFNQNEIDTIPGYHGYQMGVVIGHDFEPCETFLFGIGFNTGFASVSDYVQANTDYDQYSFQILTYLHKHFSAPFYWDAILSYTYHSYDVMRHIAVPGFSGTKSFNTIAQSDFGAHQYGVWSEVGYNYDTPQFYFEPNISLRYSNISFSEYQEVGAEGIGLRNDYNNSEIFVGGVGFKLGFKHCLKRAVMVQKLRGAIYNDFINKVQVTSSQFIGGAPVFLTPNIDSDPVSYQLGFGVEIYPKLSGNIISFDYNFDTKRDFKSHSGIFRFHYKWL